MLKIGVTGGIGSGKSVVCTIFKQLGIPIFNADIEAKRIMVSNQNVVNQIKLNLVVITSPIFTPFLIFLISV